MVSSPLVFFSLEFFVFSIGAEILWANKDFLNILQIVQTCETWKYGYNLDMLHTNIKLIFFLILSDARLLEDCGTL